ncbi:hypothetical protein PQC39_gp121 [Vibrio phage Vp_R1]|uniref:Uncharacterized protein n=1 Tax=Vibrio phage Vp_R1 TaxID=2059867 RepID=A0A2H5BQ92_9CAUD|nr:hypothetical protein PQC39_gp121 [Vibrio phage Vp_R1]AUG88485.1 hypothetical protein VPR_121 [Vibrio phage Vp_R1]
MSKQDRIFDSRVTPSPDMIEEGELLLDFPKGQIFSKDLDNNLVRVSGANKVSELSDGPGDISSANNGDILSVDGGRLGYKNPNNTLGYIGDLTFVYPSGPSEGEFSVYGDSPGEIVDPSTITAVNISLSMAGSSGMPYMALENKTLIVTFFDSSQQSGSFYQGTILKGDVEAYGRFIQLNNVEALYNSGRNSNLESGKTYRVTLSESPIDTMTRFDVLGNQVWGIYQSNAVNPSPGNVNVTNSNFPGNNSLNFYLGTTSVPGSLTDQFDKISSGDYYLVFPSTDGFIRFEVNSVDISVNSGTTRALVSVTLVEGPTNVHLSKVSGFVTLDRKQSGGTAPTQEVITYPYLGEYRVVSRFDSSKDSPGNIYTQHGASSSNVYINPINQNGDDVFKYAKMFCDLSSTKRQLFLNIQKPDGSVIEVTGGAFFIDDYYISFDADVIVELTTGDLVKVGLSTGDKNPLGQGANYKKNDGSWNEFDQRGPSGLFGIGMHYLSENVPSGDGSDNLVPGSFQIDGTDGSDATFLLISHDNLIGQPIHHTLRYMVGEKFLVIVGQGAGDGVSPSDYRSYIGTVSVAGSEFRFDLEQDNSPNKGIASINRGFDYQLYLIPGSLLDLETVIPSGDYFLRPQLIDGEMGYRFQEFGTISPTSFGNTGDEFQEFSWDPGQGMLVIKSKTGTKYDNFDIIKINVNGAEARVYWQGAFSSYRSSTGDAVKVGQMIEDNLGNGLPVDISQG